MLDLTLTFCLVFMGFVVGILSSFFGFGGGFILTPFLINIGIPANIAVGSSVTQLFMSSAIASIRHKRLGNVDIRLGLIIAFASVLGTELGAQIIEYLKKSGVQYLNFIVGVVYVLILGLISIYMFYESAELKFREKKGFAQARIRKIKTPPMITLSQTDSEPISIWIIILIGLTGGLFSGFLGAGGGFVQVPLLIYVVGYKPPIAAGTCTFAILLNCLYASLSHTLKGNVDFLLAALMFTGSFMGLQIGVSTTKYIKEASFKTTFSLCIGFTSLSVAIRMSSETFGIAFLGLLSQIIMILATSLVALFIAALAIRTKHKSIHRISNMMINEES
ncbi:MAG: sulfite exporter TauE/SafE family protein [Candidatus Bathyarchaeia archaeon]